MRSVLLAVALAACAGLAAAECLAGDLPCACKEAGGAWRELKDPLKPTCTFEFSQSINGQEVKRTFNVFLPAGYRATRRYPVWMHIHGVYWGSMDGISGKMGWNVLAMDATANWDGLVGSDKVYNSAIVVYPQSTPSPYNNPDQRMLWNLPWWHCSSGSCVDSNLDEVGYIETVIRTVLTKFAVDRSKFWVTGTSAGGMMVNYLLCKSDMFQRTATAVVDMLGGVGESFTGQCSPRRFVPHLILHGTNDPIITYYNDNLVDGSMFISTLKMAKWWQGLRGCPGEPRSEYNDQHLECTVYCEGDMSNERRRRAAPAPSAGRAPAPVAGRAPAPAAGRAAAPVRGRKKELALNEGRQSPRGSILKLCGMKGVGHDLNTPYHGYPFDIAWQFFKKQSGLE